MPAHEGTLAAVAVAAATEDGDDPPAGQPARGLHGLGQGVGGVGVIDDHREILPLLHRLEASRHSRAGDDTRNGLVQVQSQLQGRGRGR